MDIETARFSFAEELRYAAHVRSDRVISAFATVPREHFLGAPPWQAYDLQEGGYWEVPGDDARSVYHNVIFAIDTTRNLNNGHPEFWARLLDKLEIRAGDSVYHVGAGVRVLHRGDGRTSRIRRQGHRGRDRPGAGRAGASESRTRANVKVIAADGATADPDRSM